MAFETRYEELAPFGTFAWRLSKFVLISILLLTVALGTGVLGYHYICELPWIDSLLNASMLLGGMGPVDQIKTVSGKLFCSFYALFSGLVFVASFGIIVAPVIHRILHAFHADEHDGDGDDDDSSDGDSGKPAGRTSASRKSSGSSRHKSKQK